MLVVDVAGDTEVPFEEVVLLLQHGSPKEACGNPEGGHMGRTRTLPDPAIFTTVTLACAVRRLKS